ncbi:uncharacterized protein PAC_10655 [Phialocephala subalpina]|uniref:Uncharacterized protein n=1 Tax=Phialocephala subalpina TaxID=576137 RepID=A0A1L7X6X4_9HELO|nr:uncharacterized protein PAC_10655 [Phialocephala subalpina]
MENLDNKGYTITTHFATKHLLLSSSKILPAITSAQSEINAREAKLHNTGRISVPFERIQAQQMIQAFQARGEDYKANLPDTRDKMIEYLENEDNLLLSEKPDAWKAYWAKNAACRGESSDGEGAEFARKIHAGEKKYREERAKMWVLLKKEKGLSEPEVEKCMEMWEDENKEPGKFDRMYGGVGSSYRKFEFGAVQAGAEYESDEEETTELGLTPEAVAAQAAKKAQPQVGAKASSKKQAQKNPFMTDDTSNDTPAILDPEQLEEAANGTEIEDVMAAVEDLQVDLFAQHEAVAINYKGKSKEQIDRIHEENEISQLQQLALRLTKENSEIAAENNKLKTKQLNALINEPQINSEMQALKKWITGLAYESLGSLLRDLQDEKIVAEMLEPEDEDADIIIPDEFHFNIYVVIICKKINAMLTWLKCGWKSVYHQALKMLAGVKPHNALVEAHKMICTGLGGTYELSDTTFKGLWAATELAAKLEYRLNNLELQPYDLESEQNVEMFEMIQRFLMARIEDYRQENDEILSDISKEIEEDDGTRDIEFDRIIDGDLRAVLEYDPQRWMSEETLEFYGETLVQARNLYHKFAIARDIPVRGTNEWRDRIVSELPQNDSAALSTIVLELEGHSVGLFEIIHYLVLLQAREDLSGTIKYVMDKLSAKLMLEAFAEAKRRITSKSNKTQNGKDIADTLLREALHRICRETGLPKVFNFRFVDINPEEHEDPVLLLVGEMIKMSKPKTKADPLQIALQKQMVETKFLAALNTSEWGQNFKISDFKVYDPNGFHEHVRQELESLDEINRDIEVELEEVYGGESSNRKEPKHTPSQWVSFPGRQNEDLEDYGVPNPLTLGGRDFFETEAGQTMKDAFEEENRQFEEAMQSNEMLKETPGGTIPFELTRKISRRYAKILREYERTMPRIPLFPLSENIDAHTLGNKYYDPPPKPVGDVDRLQWRRLEEDEIDDAPVTAESRAAQETLNEAIKAAIENKTVVDINSIAGTNLAAGLQGLGKSVFSQAPRVQGKDSAAAMPEINVADLREEELEPSSLDPDFKGGLQSMGLFTAGPAGYKVNGNTMIVKLPGRSGSQHTFLVDIKNNMNTSERIESFKGYLESLYHFIEDIDIDDGDMTGAIRVESVENMEKILRQPRPLPKIPVDTKGKSMVISEPGPLEDLKVDIKGKGKAIDLAESGQSSLPQRPKVKFVEPESEPTPSPKPKIDIKGKSKAIDNDEGSSFRAVFQDVDERADIDPSSSYHATVEEDDDEEDYAGLTAALAESLGSTSHQVTAEDDDEEEDYPGLTAAIAQSREDINKRVGRDSEAGPSGTGPSDAGPSTALGVKPASVKAAETSDSPPIVEVPEHLVADISAILAEWKEQIEDEQALLKEKKVMYKGREHMIYDARPCNPKIEDQEGKVDRETYALHEKLEKKNFAIFKGKIVPGQASKEDIEHVKKYGNMKTNEAANLLIALSAGSVALATDFAKFARDQVGMYVEMRALVQKAYKVGPFKVDAELMRWGTRLLEFRANELEVRSRSSARTASEMAATARRGYRNSAVDVPKAPKEPKKQSNKSLKIAAQRAKRGN